MSEKFFQIDEKTWVNPKYFQPTKNTIYKCDYFFVTKIKERKRKTPIYYIFEFNTNCIGEIKWYSPWRKFCFYPDKNTVWCDECLKEIMNFMLKINIDYKNKK